MPTPPFGFNALANNQTGTTDPGLGSSNTALGYQALGSNTLGNANTAFGKSALFNNTGGNYNTASGFNALFNTTGAGNTASGAGALSTNTTGLYNIAIGYNAGLSATTGSYNIYIGSPGGTAAEGNTIRIGTPFASGSGQSKTFIAGISGVNVGAQPAVLVDSNGQLGVNTSSRRFKYDIQDMDEATKKLLRLRPVTFRYKQAQNDGAHPLQYGLIAEEVAEVLPELVAYDASGQPSTVLYHVLPAMLLNEFQKQYRQIEAQQEQIQSLKEQLAQLATQTSQLHAELAAFKGQGEQASKIAGITPQP